jgi:hypothetical protein
MEELNQEYLEPLSSIGRYQVISKTYQDEFGKCILLIFDSNTGEIKKQVFDLK